MAPDPDPRRRRRGFFRGRRRRGISRLRRRIHRKLSILTLGGVATGFATPVGFALTNPSPMAGNKAIEFLRQLGIATVGYDIEANKFYGGNLAAFYVPIIAGYIGHRIMNLIGVNRVFRKLPVNL
jgi:hypothetical protein